MKQTSHLGAVHGLLGAVRGLVNSKPFFVTIFLLLGAPTAMMFGIANPHSMVASENGRAAMMGVSVGKAMLVLVPDIGCCNDPYSSMRRAVADEVDTVRSPVVAHRESQVLQRKQMGSAEPFNHTIPPQFSFWKFGSSS